MTQLKEQFQKQGFVIIPKALETSLVQQLIEATDRTLNNEKFSYDLLKINKSQHIHKDKYMFEKEEIFLIGMVSPKYFYNWFIYLDRKFLGYFFIGRQAFHKLLNIGNFNQVLYP